MRADEPHRKRFTVPIPGGGWVGPKRGLESKGKDCVPRHSCRTWKEEGLKMELELGDAVVHDGSKAPAFSVIQIIQIPPMTCHKDEARIDMVGPFLSPRYPFLRPLKIRHDPPKRTETDCHRCTAGGCPRPWMVLVHRRWAKRTR
jgi:hypothetical protein